MEKLPILIALGVVLATAVVIYLFLLGPLCHVFAEPTIFC